MTFYQVMCVLTALTLLTKESESQLAVCGRPELNSRIIGGDVAPAGSWPWMVYVQIPPDFCGGSLINSLWVLTAAHCVSGKTPAGLTVFLGLQSLQGSNPNQVSRTVAQIIVHPNYNSGTNDNDIALLRLTSPVTFTSYISPVCLAASDSSFYSGVSSWVTGWGLLQNDGFSTFPVTLMEVEVPVVGNRQCNCNYGVGSITNNMICAGLPQGGKDSCQGDSGGPMVSKQGGRWIQSGIVSFGLGCAKTNNPGVYTRVSQYQNWINTQITSNQPGFMTFSSIGFNSDRSVSCAGLPAEPVVCGQVPLNFDAAGGSVVMPGQWPWIASLQRRGRHVCGGTLVSEDFVLSSADCFSGSTDPSDWTVILGRLKLNGSNPSEVFLNVTNITRSNQTGSNIVLLQLSDKPTLNNYIQPICLDFGRNFSEGSTCWTVGWSSAQGGEEQVLQQFQTSVVNCGNISDPENICTQQVTLGQGDSGSPLMCERGGAWFQVVVVPAVGVSIRGADAEMTVFDKLDRFQDFLTQTLGTLLSPPSIITTSNTNSINVTTTSPSTNITMTTGGSSPSCSSFFLLVHLLTFISCLQTFT